MNLTKEQLNIIENEKDRLSFRQLSKKLGIEKAELRRILKKMEKSGFKPSEGFWTRFQNSQAGKALFKIRANFWFWPVFFFALSLLLRLAYFSQIKNDPLIYFPILDAAYYDGWAKDILAGKEFTQTAFFVEPGYAYILAFFYKFFSFGSKTVIFFQFLLSALTAAVIFFLGKRLFGNLAAFVAALLTVFLRPLLFYDALLLKTTFEIFLVSVILLLTSFVWERKSKPLFLLLGILIGLTALIKSNILYAAPILALAYLFKDGRSLEKLKANWMFPAILLLGVAASISPVTFRNWQKSHSIVPINYSGGANLYIGNWEGSDGSLRPPEFISVSPESEEISWRKMTEAYLGKDITPAEVSSYWTGRAIQASLENPGFFLKNTFKKVALLFHSTPLDDNYSLDYALEKFSLLNFTLPLWIVYWFGGAGLIIILLKKNQRSKLAWMLAILGGYALTLVAAHVAERYRLALFPMFAVLSGFFFAWLIESFQTKKIGSILSAGFFMMLGLTIVFLPLGDITKTMPFDTWNNIGSAALEKNQKEWALYSFKRSVEESDKFPPAHNNLGKYYLEEGNIENALAEFRKSLKIQPDGPTEMLKIAMEAKKNSTSTEEIKKQLENLENFQTDEIFDPSYIEAMKFLRKKDYKNALPLFEKMAEKSSGNSRVLTNLGLSYKNNEQLEKAQEVLKKAVEIDGYNLSARYNLSNVHIINKRYDLAVEQLKAIDEMSPGFMTTQLQLGDLYQKLGKSNEAGQAFQAFADDPDNETRYPEELAKVKKILESSKQPNIPKQ